MEYHSDRFDDFSLLFYDDNQRLIAVMPASCSEHTLTSHGGLTYGGVVSDRQMKAPKMIEVFSALKNYLVSHQFEKLVYKAIPHIYHRFPSEEDLYALYLNEGRLFRRDVSSTIFMKQRIPFSKGRKSCIAKTKKLSLKVKQSFNFHEFMSIEIKHLDEKYSQKPVHSAEEISYLATRFPDNIKLFVAYQDTEMLGGTIIYETSEVAHAQYIAATKQGKDLSVLDAIMDYLINEFYSETKYFDFGISTEDQGQYLNLNLIVNKESFGARSIVYDFYEMDLK